MKKINKVIPYIFEGYLVLALDNHWIEIFNGIPTFEVFIDDSQRLHLVSQEVIQNASGSEKTEKI